MLATASRIRLAALLLTPLLLLGAGDPPARRACAGDNGGLVLAEGLCAVLVVSDAGSVRQSYQRSDRTDMKQLIDATKR